MKVLFSGAWNPRFEALPEYLVTAFRNEGHQVVCFDHRNYHIPGRIRQVAPVLQKMDTILLNRRLMREANRFRPDLLVVNQGSAVTPDTIKKIRQETGAVTINWWSDYPAEFEAGLNTAASGAWDRFFVSGTDAEERHHRAGIAGTTWLPFACDPCIQAPSGPCEEESTPPEPTPGIVFVGSAYPERRDLLAVLADLDLGIWGPGWNRYADDPVIGARILGGPLRPDRWVPLFQKAEIVLNLSYGFGKPEEVYGTMANVRVFEIAACGACQVVDGKKDILDLFTDQVHLASFQSAAELREVVISLLGDRDRRLRIGRAGREAVLAHHTWEHRVRFLAGQVLEVRSAGRKVAFHEA